MDKRIKVSVIIMTLNAEKYIQNIISALYNQTIIPDEIIIADSESDDRTLEIALQYNQIKIITIKRSEFDHGGSRDIAFRKSVGDFVFFLTQDAEIANNMYIEKMLSNFEDQNVAMAYGRQIAKKDAILYERYIREFNYPNIKMIRTQDDIESMGIKAFYMSDVCSCYRRTAYIALGGFEHPIRTNEDMLIAAKALKKGYKTVYEPQACVYHSHNFTCKQEYNRNRIVAEFMKEHKEEFDGLNINGEGIKLVKYVSKKLLLKGKFIIFIRFGIICCAKFLGNKKGKYCINKNSLQS